MSSLAALINNLINEEIGKFIEKISNKFDIPKQELEELWNSDDKPITKKPEQHIPVESIIKPITKKPEQHIPVESIIKPIIKNTTQTVVKSSEDDNKCKGCPYVWSRGDKSGTICGSIPKNGSVYCSRHKKYEGIETKAKKVLPTNKKTISSVSKKKSLSPSKEVGLTLHKNKDIDKLWDPNTKMVFKSISEKKVIGKYEDGEIKNLSSEDINCCKQHGFAFEEQKSSENACISKLMNSIEKFKIEENKKENSSTHEIKDNTDTEIVKPRIRKSPTTKKSPTPNKEISPTDEEEILDEELPDDTEIVKPRIRRSPTTKKSPTPKKAISPKKVSADNAKNVKKTIDSAILTTNLKAGDVEEILGELQLSLDTDNESDEDILEEDELKDDDLEEDIF